MKLNLGSILRLFGIDASSPLEILRALVPLVGQPALARELSTHLTDARRAEVVAGLRRIADDLDAKQFDKAAADILALLSGVKA